MPAKSISVNLLGQQDLEHTPWGRIISWATTYGRYIMITTEVIVLLAFVSRFTLDRQLTDLTEEVEQKQAIIQANAEFEQDIKSIQANMTTIKQLMGKQEAPVALIVGMESLIPPDVYFTSFELSGAKLSVAAIAGTTQGFSQFLSNVQSSSLVKNVIIGNVNRSPSAGIEFGFTADVAGIAGK